LAQNTAKLCKNWILAFDLKTNAIFGKNTEISDHNIDPRSKKNRICADRQHCLSIRGFGGTRVQTGEMFRKKTFLWKKTEKNLMMDWHKLKTNQFLQKKILSDRKVAKSLNTEKVV
jgi:hypothetical protein